MLLISFKKNLGNTKKRLFMIYFLDIYHLCMPVSTGMALIGQCNQGDIPDKNGHQVAVGQLHTQ